jgi:hypothetical protein
MSTAFEVKIFAIVGFLGSGKPACSDRILDSFGSARPVHRQARIRRGNGRLPGTGELTATAVVSRGGRAGAQVRSASDWIFARSPGWPVLPERELRLHNDAQQPGCPHPVVTHVPHAYVGEHAQLRQRGPRLALGPEAPSATGKSWPGGDQQAGPATRSMTVRQPGQGGSACLLARRPSSLSIWSSFPTVSSGQSVLLSCRFAPVRHGPVSIRSLRRPVRKC